MNTEEDPWIMGNGPIIAIIAFMLAFGFMAILSDSPEANFAQEAKKVR